MPPSGSRWTTTRSCAALTPDQLIAVAERLDERILQQCADYWASRLVSVSLGASRGRGSTTRWSVAQMRVNEALDLVRTTGTTSV